MIIVISVAVDVAIWNVNTFDIGEILCVSNQYQSSVELSQVVIQEDFSIVFWNVF